MYIIFILKSYIYVNTTFISQALFDYQHVLKLCHGLIFLLIFNKINYCDTEW